MRRRQAGSSGCAAGAVERPRRAAEAPIAEAHLAGMTTRRVRRASAGRFAGMVGKDRVGRARQRTRSAWEARPKRAPAGEGIVRPIPDGTRSGWTRKRATAIARLIGLGIRRDGQQVVPAIEHPGGASEAARRRVLVDLAARGMGRPELLSVAGGKGLEAALASLWDAGPVQRCTVHQERNLLAHPPRPLHEASKAECNDRLHAETAAAVQAERKAFLARWKLRCRPVADSLEEAAERLSTCLRYPAEPWRSLGTSNAIERLQEEFKRRLETPCLLPGAETAAMLFRALPASAQITLRKVDGWPSLARPPAAPDLAARADQPWPAGTAPFNSHQPRDTTLLQPPPL